MTAPKLVWTEFHDYHGDGIEATSERYVYRIRATETVHNDYILSIYYRYWDNDGKQQRGGLAHSYFHKKQSGARGLATRWMHRKEQRKVQP